MKAKKYHLKADQAVLKRGKIYRCERIDERSLTSKPLPLVNCDIRRNEKAISHTFAVHALCSLSVL